VPHSFKYRILVVDDDEPLLATTSAVLSGEGYLVETARDGFEALAVLREAVPEILVSDLKMPNMSGFELLAVVRKRFPSIGVIAMSGEFVPAGMPEGILADRYLTKGENSDFELVEAVRELLSQSPVRAQPARPETAPAWLPRSERGYIVVTCPRCLRSFSALRRQAEPGLLLREKCIHCGIDVNYRIDRTIADSAQSPDHVEESRMRLDVTRRRITESRGKIDHTPGASSAPDPDNE
jgi:CheY-like chemotaxis protein